MKRFEEKELEQLRRGDNRALRRLFDNCFADCLSQLRSSMNCQKADGEDVLMDSMLVIRDKVISGDFLNENVKAYWVTVARNKLKNKLKRDKRLIQYDVEHVEALLQDEADQYESEESTLRLRKILSSLNKISNPCKKLLTLNLVEGHPLKNLVEELDYSSYDVIKTTKSRCMKKLRTFINSSNS